MKAIIAGGGIGGLTAALCFHYMGWDVTVLEQAQQLREVGAGIQLSPNACHVFAALGLLDDLQAAAFRPQTLDMRWGRSGRTIFSVPVREQAMHRWGAPYLHMHRADLVNFLAQRLEARAGRVLRTGAAVAGYEQQGERVAARLANEDRVNGDLLVGADGIHSALRTQMHGREQPRFTGCTAWRATVPVERLGDHAPPASACVWTGAHRHAVTYYLRGGTMANFVGVVERKHWQGESWTERGERSEVRSDFAGWHPTITTLIDQADAHYRWALLDRKPLPHWNDGRVVLLGDACHPMLPFMAQGAAMAAEDGWVLARACTNADDPAVGAARYFASRCRRTTRMQAAARANMKVFHRPLAAAYVPHWGATRLWPGLVYARQDWAYGTNVVRQGGV